MNIGATQNALEIYTIKGKGGGIFTSLLRTLNNFTAWLVAALPAQTVIYIGTKRRGIALLRFLFYEGTSENSVRTRGFEGSRLLLS
jgi:hypothetical protein